MRQLPLSIPIPLGWFLLILSSLPLRCATIQCDDNPCGNNRIQICHFNGHEYQTLCIRQNSVLRKPQHTVAGIQDYCGPCKTSFQAFQTSHELRTAVSQYISEDHYNTELATTYGWPMNQWNVSLVTDFSELFARKSLNEDLSDWDTSSATNMDRMFWHCDRFESGGIWRWDVSKVESMRQMFWGATAFNGDISQWVTSQVSNLMGTFWRATSFNQDIGFWDTSQVTDVSRLFAEATTFDQDLSDWNTTRMQDLSYMFLQATSFSQGDLSQWDLTNAITLERMLYKVPAYETSVSRQDALLTAWKRQWANAGRHVDGEINFKDMFSCLNNEQREEPPEPKASSYIRGGKAYIAPQEC